MNKSKTIMQALALGLALVFFVAPVGAADLPRAEPEEVGLSAERLARIDDFMQAHIDKGHVAAMQILVARHGKVAYFNSAGVRDLDSGAPVKDDTIFRLYSQTKPVTSVAIMMLYEEGKLRLTDPVSKFLPDLKGLEVYVSGEGDDMVTEPASREVTIHDLLTHRSGFTYYFLADTPVARLYGERGINPNGLTADDDAGLKDVDLAEFIRRLGTVPLNHQPGTEWHYGVSLDVLGRVVEVASGQTLDVFFEEHIFEPLGMVDTAFFVPEDKLDRFTVNYSSGPDGQLVVADPINGVFASKPALLSGGAGLASTSADYFQFAQMMLNKGEWNGVRLLSQKSVEYMTTDHLPKDQKLGFFKGVGFGLGVGVLVDPIARQGLGSVGEFSWGGAASTDWFASPADDVVVLFMTQLLFNQKYPFGADLRRLVYQSIEGE